MVQGTLTLCCKVCGNEIQIPWGHRLSPLELQCSFGCYEIYPGVLSWNARRRKLKILRAAAVELMKKYQTYDRLVQQCSRIVAEDRGGTIHVTATISEPATPTPTKRSPKSPQKVNS